MVAEKGDIGPHALVPVIEIDNLYRALGPDCGCLLRQSDRPDDRNCRDGHQRQNNDGQLDCGSDEPTRDTGVQASEL